MSHHAPWMHAIDVQMDTHKWCLDPRTFAFNGYFFESLYGEVHWRPEDNREAAIYASVKLVLESLWRGDTIYVTDSMMSLGLQAAHDLPDDVDLDPRVMITPCGFMLFESPINGSDKDGDNVTFNAISWIREQDRIALIFWVDPYDWDDETNKEMRRVFASRGVPIPPLTIQHFMLLREDAPLPAGRGPGEHIVTEGVRLWYALQLLSHQKIGTPVVLSPDRATRKRIQREYGGQDRMITLITLRRKKVINEGEPSKVEWSRRWVVRGHWRRQWYPKSKTHDWVYIYEHIRGPEDKPLVITERRVFDFRR